MSSHDKAKDILYVVPMIKVSMRFARQDDWFSISRIFSYRFENNGKKFVLHTKGLSVLNSEKEILKIYSDFKKGWTSPFK
jgi:hypothetical protein